MDGSEEQKCTRIGAEKCRLFPSVRLLVIFIAGLGTGVEIICRYNVSMAVVCMVDDSPVTPGNRTSGFGNVVSIRSDTLGITIRRLNIVEENRQAENVTYTADVHQADIKPDSTQNDSPSQNKVRQAKIPYAEFNWDKTFQGLLLSSFFYGYTAALVPGGWVADKLPANIVLMAGVGTQTVFTMLFPTVARTSEYFLLALRAAQGICSSLVQPVCTVLIRNWSVPEEYSTLFAVAWALGFLCSGLNFPICSFLCQFGGWPMVFYVTGAFPLVWVLLAWFLMPNCPNESVLCSEEEKQYILSKRQCRIASFKAHSEQGSKPASTPFFSIFTNLQVLIVVGSFFSYSWFYYSLNITMPTFIAETMGVSLTENGFLSALSTVSTTIGVLFGGRLYECLLVRCAFTRTRARKLISSFAMLFPAALLVGILFLPPGSKFATMALLSTANLIGVFCVSGGPLSAGPEIGPQYAGIIWGLAGSIGNLSGVLSPILAAFMTPNKTLAEWRNFFLVSVVLLVMMDAVIVLFWKSEVQPFAKTEELKQGSNENKGD